MFFLGKKCCAAHVFPVFQDFIQLTFQAHEVDLHPILGPPMATHRHRISANLQEATSLRPHQSQTQDIICNLQQVQNVQSMKAPGLEELDNSSHHSRTSALAPGCNELELLGRKIHMRQAALCSFTSRLKKHVEEKINDWKREREKETWLYILIYLIMYIYIYTHTYVYTYSYASASSSCI